MLRWQTFLLIGLIVVVYTIGHFVRAELPIEISVQSIQAWVSTLSWKGPLLYLALMTFRQFLLLPSAILLPVAGLCFGALFGTALGAGGIFLSGLLKFTLARTVRDQWGSSVSNANLKSLIARVNDAGPLVVGVVTAHPIGPMVPLHWAAGFSSIPVGKFLVALAIGGMIRAAAFAFLGSTLIGPNPLPFYAACATLLAIIVLPFTHLGLRRRLITVLRR